MVLNRRCNWRTLLGLMALAVQFVAGFAHHHHHVHVSGAEHIHHAQHVLHNGLVLRSFVPVQLAIDHASRDGDHDPEGSDENHTCDICLALAMLRNAGLPDTFAVISPSTVPLSVSAARANAATHTLAWRAHGARAPPRGLLA